MKKSKKVIPLERGSWAISGFVYFFMTVVLLIVVYPFYYCFILSFNDGNDAVRGGIYFFPRMFTLENYIRIFERPIFYIAAFNSILRTVIGALAGTLVAGMFAYCISRPEFYIGKFLLLMLTITMYFNAGIIPNFLLIRSLGLLDSFWVYILPALCNAFNVIIMVFYFKSIPASLIESARLDGANEAKIFFKIMLPVSIPIFATVILFTGVGQWNSWFDRMLFTSRLELETLAHYMMVLVNERQAASEGMGPGGAIGGRGGATPNSMMLAVMVVTSFPIIVLYPLLQRYFISGIMIGSVKE